MLSIKDNSEEEKVWMHGVEQHHPRVHNSTESDSGESESHESSYTQKHWRYTSGH